MAVAAARRTDRRRSPAWQRPVPHLPGRRRPWQVNPAPKSRSRSARAEQGHAKCGCASCRLGERECQIACVLSPCVGSVAVWRKKAVHVGQVGW
eukprot:352223-Rhodomonas_salina.2